MAAELFYLPFATAFTSNGLPAAGAKLYFYLPGTLTPTDVFTTSALTTVHAHPVVADGAGRHAAIYLDGTKTYRMIAKDRDGNTLADVASVIPGTIAGAVNPIWSVATGAAGTSVTITGTYPTQTITIPRGDTGASGALSDGTFGGIAVSGGGTALNVVSGHITLARMANLATDTFIGRDTAGTGVPEALSVATVKTMLSLNNVDNTADTAKPVSTVQQTALDLKQNLIPNIQSVTSNATVTPTFLNDLVSITAQAAALNLANPTGTAQNGWAIAIRIKDNGTARAITYGTQYRALGITLPTTTVVSKTLYLGMVYNSVDTKWDVVSVAQEA